MLEVSSGSCPCFIGARVKRGQRDRVHNHFARGLLHCGRCHAAGREHRFIFAEPKNYAGEIYEYFLGRGHQDGLCDLPYLPVAELARALQHEFRTVTLSPDGIATARQEVGAALERVLANQAKRQARLRKELKKLDVQEERLVDLAAEGALATEKLRARLRDLQIKKHEVRTSLETTTESLEQRTQMVLSYLDMMARPNALFTSVPGSVRRKLLAAFWQRI